MTCKAKRIQNYLGNTELIKEILKEPCEECKKKKIKRLEEESLKGGFLVELDSQ